MMTVKGIVFSHRIEHMLREIVDACLWIGGIFIIGFVLVFNNFFSLAKEIFFPSTGQKLSSSSPVIIQNYSTTSEKKQPFVIQNNKDKMSTTHGISTVTEKMHTHSLSSYLKDRILTYKTPFSILPPGKHLRIYRLGVEAPIKDVSYASADTMEHGSFENELKQGVVKYPFTADPGTSGNTLIFGHSSVDYREGKDNPYGFIFSQLHELEIGDMIELVWDGKQIIYSVEETVIKNPKDVNDIIEAYKNNKYLTLMACYPRFSTAKRILVIAKEISKEDLSKRTMAFNKQSPL